MVTKLGAASCLSWLLYIIGGLMLVVSLIGWFAGQNNNSIVYVIPAFACLAAGLLFDLLSEIGWALYRLENNENRDFEIEPVEDNES